MKITDECKMHLQTADLLLQGIRESMAVLEKGEFLPPPEHSVNSVRSLPAWGEWVEIMAGQRPASISTVSPRTGRVD